jgi:GrpB-like predicted nucleotidyltransferase (UPF0157 family)
MRQHPEEVDRYGTIKRDAIAKGKTDPSTYQQAKTPYLLELAQRIDREVAQPPFRGS